MIIKKYSLIFLLFGSVVLFFSYGCETTLGGRQSPLPGESKAHFPQMIVGDRAAEVIGIPNPPALELDFPLFVGKKGIDEFTAYSKSGLLSHSTNEYIAAKTIGTKADSFNAFKIIRHPAIPGTSWRGIEEYGYSPEAKGGIQSFSGWEPGLEWMSDTTAKAGSFKNEKSKIKVEDEKIKIGIIEFQSLNEEAKKDILGKVFSEVLTTSFVNSDAFKIIEREQLEKVLKEFQLTQSGIIDTASAKQIGKMVGADAILTGSVIKFGNDLRVDARIIDVESGIILTAEKSIGKADLKSISTMADLIVQSLVNKFYKDKK